ncbi:MAG: endolytic transglycosylase MltG [Alkaliphilus sp.]
MKKIIFFLLIIILLITVSYVGFTYYIGAALPEIISDLLSPHLSVSTFTESVDIVIPKGKSLNYVSNLLYKKGVIKNIRWFNYQGQLLGVDTKIKPGSYVIEPNMTFDDIFSLIQQGNPIKPIVLVIPEGHTIFQMAKEVEKMGFGTAEEFIIATEEIFSLKNLPFNTENLYFVMEGYLLPDTYHFTNASTPKDIAFRMATTMSDFLETNYIERINELNLSIHEVLTIASLVEREAYSVDEMPTISGVIHNRLYIDMLLQLCPTVIYGYGKGEEHLSRVLYSHLQYENPFNTYMNLGLPPGPIAAPGRDAIHAALFPKEHDYLFYALSVDGHAFSETYAEHLRNVAKLRRLQDNN